MTDTEDGANMEDIDYAASAEQAYAERENFDNLEPVEVEIDPNVRSVVSVRFNRGELGSVERASLAAGVPLSTFIRNAALRAASETESENSVAVQSAILAMQSTIEILSRNVPGAEGEGRARPTKKRARKRAATKTDPADFMPHGYDTKELSAGPTEPKNHADPSGRVWLGARRRLAVDLLPFDHDVAEEFRRHPEGVER